MNTNKFGYTIYKPTHIKGTHTSLLIDDKEQWLLYLNMAENASRLRIRTHVITLVNKDNDIIFIWVYDWNKAYDRLASDEFYEEYRVQQCFRWVYILDAFPFYSGLQGNKIVQTTYDFLRSTYSTKYYILNYCKWFNENNLEQLKLNGTHIGEETIKMTGYHKPHARKYSKYNLTELTTIIDGAFSTYDSIKEYIFSINCGCMGYGDWFIQYDVKGRELNVILYVLDEVIYEEDNK